VNVSHRMTRCSRGGCLSRRISVGALAFAVGVGGGGCGTNDGPSEDVAVGRDDEGAWVHQVLDGSPNPDSPVLLATDGEQVIVVVVAEDGAITGHVADGDEPFAVGRPTAGGRGFTVLGGIARTDDSWLALSSGGTREDATGDEQPVFELRAHRSSDGLSWTEVTTTGLYGPADITGVVAVPGGVVAVGTLRTADDPSIGGFRPVAWHSEDGERWTAHELAPTTREGDPFDPAAEGFVESVAVAGDSVVAVGQAGGRGIVWRSEDGGRTWEAATEEELAGIGTGATFGRVAAQEDVVVLSGTVGRGGEEGRPGQTVWRSTDGGRSWEEATEPPPPSRGETFASPVFAGSGRFFLVSTSFHDALAEPALCYADIELCRQDAAVALYTSDDGDAWHRVDTSGVTAAPGDEGDSGEFDAVTATDGGRVVGVRRGLGGVGTWAWPAGAALPTMDEPADPASDVEVLQYDDPIEPGVRSALPLYIHCGMDWLYADDDAWQRADGGSDVETGAGDQIPGDWPVAQQTIFGYATLVDDDRIDYSIGDDDDTEVIATYERSTEEPPGCE
jgi:hypothetical protein